MRRRLIAVAVLAPAALGALAGASIALTLRGSGPRVTALAAWLEEHYPETETP